MDPIQRFFAFKNILDLQSKKHNKMIYNMSQNDTQLRRMTLFFLGYFM